MGKYKNTIERGKVRFIVFREEDTWFGVALEFNIVVEGSDQKSVLIEIIKAINGYVKSAKIASLRPSVLNQKPEKEYQRLWQVLESGKEMKRNEGEELSIKPSQVFTFGTVPQFA